MDATQLETKHLSQGSTFRFFRTKAGRNQPITHILSWRPLLCIRCIGLLFPPIGSLSLGDFNNFELDEDDAPAPPPLDERLLPPPPLLPLLFEDRDEYKENTEEEGGVRGGLLEELCLLSGTKNPPKTTTKDMLMITRHTVITPSTLLPISMYLG